MSGLPYKFEPGMRVSVNGCSGCSALVVGFGGHEPSVLLYFADGDYTDWVKSSVCTADLDHPGTRGLLLQQYRDASGNPDAVAIRDDGSDWIVDRDPASTYSPVVGRGESEGAAIFDALTRLAAERARESEPCLRIDESVFQQRVLTRLDSIEQRLRAMESGRGGRTIVLSTPADPDNTEGP